MSIALLWRRLVCLLWGHDWGFWRRRYGDGRIVYNGECERCGRMWPMTRDQWEKDAQG